MVDSEDDQFHPGYRSLPTVLDVSISSSTSSSVALMLEKKRHQSQIGFAGVWKRENVIDNEERKEEEIQNELSQSGNEFDFGFEKDIMDSNSMIWSKNNNQINVVRSSNWLNKSEYHSEADDTELLRLDQNDLMQNTNPKPGNISLQTDGLALHNTEGLEEISLQYKYNSLEGDNGDSENISAFPNSDIADNVANSRTQTLEASFHFSLNHQSNVSEHKQDVCLNNRLGSKKRFEIINMSETPDTVDRTVNGDKSVERHDKTEESKPTDAKQHEVDSKKSSVNKSNEEPEGQRVSAVEETRQGQSSKSNCSSGITNDWQSNQRYQDNITNTNRSNYGSTYNQNTRYPKNKTRKDSYYYPAWSPFSTTFFTYHTRILEEFARDNDFEVFDVPADGNCMFCSMEDQLRINAQFGETADSLRKRAVRYLRMNPIQKNGVHFKDFLSSKETWESYLNRMERNSTWGDHLTLQALSEVTRNTIVVLNLSQEDIRRTEIVPSDPDQSHASFFLGHIGEYHYLSLRPKNWERIWPERAHLYKEKLSSHQILRKYIEAKLDLLELRKKLSDYEKIVMENKKVISFLTDQDAVNKTESCKAEHEVEARVPQTPTEPGSWEEEEGFLTEQLAKLHKLRDEIPECFKYRGWITNQKEESLLRLAADPLYIDPESGVPSPHLSFILQCWIQSSIQLPVPQSFGITTVPKNCVVEYAGSGCDESNAVLVSQSDGLSTVVITSNTPMKIICRSDIVVQFIANEDKKEKEIFVDESQTHPGYCRLRPSVENNVLWGSQLFFVENNCFIRESNFAEMGRWREYQGFQSHEWIPSRTDWVSRARPSGWPSEELKEKILKAGVLFVRRPHASSKLDSVEWQMIFSRAEKEIFLSVLSSNQKNCYNIFKVLVDHQTSLCQANLAPTHLKAVFLYAMEVIPSNNWDKNVGGCVLYLIHSLSCFLESETIPHYFISENNIIDHIPSNAIKELKLQVNAIKHFPIEVIQFCIKKNKLCDSYLTQVIADIDSYNTSQDISWTVQHIFVYTLKMWAKHDGEYFNFNKAFDRIFRAFGIYQDMLAITKDTDGETFEAFALSALDRWSDVKRFKMIKMIEEKCNTKLCTENQTESPVFVRSLLGNEIESDFCDMPIPTYAVGNKGDQAKLLEEIATVSYFLKNNEEALAFIKEAISLLKKALLEDILDVSEVEDAVLKKEIGHKNVKLTTKWNTQLATCYEKLSTCCVVAHRQDVLLEYMPEIESLAVRHPSMVDFVDKTWNSLDQAEKGKKFKKEHSGFQKNYWDQNDYNDVD